MAMKSLRVRRAPVASHGGVHVAVGPWWTPCHVEGRARACSSKRWWKVSPASSSSSAPFGAHCIGLNGAQAGVGINEANVRTGAVCMPCQMGSSVGPPLHLGNSVWVSTLGGRMCNDARGGESWRAHSDNQKVRIRVHDGAVCSGKELAFSDGKLSRYPKFKSACSFAGRAGCDDVVVCILPAALGKPGLREADDVHLFVVQLRC